MVRGAGGRGGQVRVGEGGNSKRLRHLGGADKIGLRCLSRLGTKTSHLTPHGHDGRGEKTIRQGIWVIVRRPLNRVVRLAGVIRGAPTDRVCAPRLGEVLGPGSRHCPALPL